MDRLVQRNVLAMSGRAVEAAGDTQTLLLDKTGTITLGNRMASDVLPRRRSHRTGSGRRGPAGVAGRRDAGGPLDRRARQGTIRHPRPGSSARTTTSSLSRPRRGCPASISARARSARVPLTRSSVGSLELGGSIPADLDASWSASRGPGRRRSLSPTGGRSSAS